MRAQEATTATSCNSEPLNSSHGIPTYIFTGLAVLAAYVHLLTINISYIKLFIIPVSMLVFIGAVGSKFYSRDRLQYDNSSQQTGFVNRFEMLVALATVTFVPQLLQLLSSGLDKIVGQQNDSFLISHFLFFFSSAIGALQVMTATLPLRTTSLGVAQVLQMTFSVVLFTAVHAKATEWVGEDMVLVCMPELIGALLWFTIHFDHGGHTIRIDKVVSLKSGVLFILSAVMILLSMFVYERKVPAKWYTRVLVSCTLSGMLSYYSKWMISESGNSAKLPIQLLEFSAYICSVISATLALVLAIEQLRLEVSHQETERSFIDVVKAAIIALVSPLLSLCPVVWIRSLHKHSSANTISSRMSVVMNKLSGMKMIIIYSFLLPLLPLPHKGDKQLLSFERMWVHPKKLL